MAIADHAMAFGHRARRLKPPGYVDKAA